ncbi:hypothetical protein EDD18DRAFT_1160490 [Armillaria luteobubalina]|uniref:Uncharacterized protein n=1 Tax=Armillaria luteobubalina TaxID=153913 RepID=A0AA39Q9W4_9AGAR|nr:hypothetical protein EDD18DRAFT_1160490 [Armillaria luteobubalina]
MCYKRGIVLGGHSGIGKSMFLFYALIRCLQESQDVIFHFGGRTLVFSKGGVKEIHLNFSYDSFGSLIWCLVDSYGGEPSTRARQPRIYLSYTRFITVRRTELQLG